MEFSERLPNVDRDNLTELTHSVAESARVLFSAGSVQQTLDRVVELAVATIEGCDFAGIFLMTDEIVTTSAFTDPLVVEIDALQQAHAQGPCLDAIMSRLIMYADELSSEVRWSDFSPLAVNAGIRSVLALPLTADAQLGVLNLYARYPAAFGAVDRAKATILASLASLALALAHTHEDEERRSENLQAALVTREIIGRALGILMERERISTQQAFDILRRASQRLNIKLREVAKRLVETGEDPDADSIS
ncbi:MAG TPA: GAF and ANTAR domain-containing protein [Acidimicrobiales bacterium]|jgi:GAF domain-containing protein|nr:GAF and ANTAR domain-containing protein [Acidimicrobiales bacterium]